MDIQTLCDEAHLTTPCLAKDCQEAMEWINNIGVAYLDVGEISIAKAFFIQALRLRAQKTAELEEVLESAPASATQHPQSSADESSLIRTTPSSAVSENGAPALPTTTFSSSTINITVLATQTVISAAKRGRERVSPTTIESRTFSAQVETTLFDCNPFLHDSAFAFTRRNHCYEIATDTSHSPLLSTALVIFNLGLVHHILGLMNASQHREMTYRAQLLYEESKSLMDLHLRKVKQQGHETSESPNIDRLRMATYNNLALLAFELGDYTTSTALMDRLRPIVTNPSDSDECKRQFLLNSLLLVPPTVAAVA